MNTTRGFYNYIQCGTRLPNKGMTSYRQKEQKRREQGIAMEASGFALLHHSNHCAKYVLFEAGCTMHSRHLLFGASLAKQTPRRLNDRQKVKLPPTSSNTSYQFKVKHCTPLSICSGFDIIARCWPLSTTPVTPHFCQICDSCIRFRTSFRRRGS